MSILVKSTYFIAFRFFLPFGFSFWTWIVLEGYWTQVRRMCSGCGRSGFEEGIVAVLSVMELPWSMWEMVCMSVNCSPPLWRSRWCSPPVKLFEGVKLAVLPRNANLIFRPLEFAKFIMIYSYFNIFYIFMTPSFRINLLAERPAPALGVFYPCCTLPLLGL